MSVDDSLVETKLCECCEMRPRAHGQTEQCLVCTHEGCHVLKPRTDPDHSPRPDEFTTENTQTSEGSK